MGYNSKRESMGKLLECNFKFVGPKVIADERKKEGKERKRGTEAA